uniref:Uncharacterized protein n=1 Tax=Arundo donax TaxID=35708 RepID=A0A0A9AA24_ARUDO
MLTPKSTAARTRQRNSSNGRIFPCHA